MTIRESSGSAKIPLADNARVVLERRYLAKDSEGRPVETPEEMFRRVAHNIAQAELLYKPLEDVSTRSADSPSPDSPGESAKGTGQAERPRIGMSEGVLAAANVLREFMFQRVYLWEGRREEAEQAKQVVRFLFRHYLSRPEEIDSDFVITSDPPWRRVTDYVAGMTDGFALTTAERLGHRV